MAWRTAGLALRTGEVGMDEMVMARTPARLGEADVRARFVHDADHHRSRAGLAEESSAR
ncbi:MAG: hypothetical protein U0893_03280 [Chloroflexota bacterium]